MLIESFLTSYMRYSTRRLLAFKPTPSPVIPTPGSDKACLLYIHVPFCESICPYCSFNRVEFNESLALGYFEALKKEIRMYHDLGFKFETVYVGGGTPTVMPGELAKVLDLIRGFWSIRQISVETNPNHLTSEIVATLKSAGVGRLSVGVETFDDALLANLGRLDAYGAGADIQKKLSAVQGTFETLNVDLMFNLPGQDRASLISDMNIVKDLNIDQATFYPLMCSSATKNTLEADSGEGVCYRNEAELYSEIAEHMSEPYRAASAWCFSRQQGMIDEYIVDHEEYIGVGSGSFGYIDGTIYSNTFSVPKYIELLKDDILPLAASRSFARSERVGYDLLMRLFGGSLKLKDMSDKYGALVWLNLGVTISFLTATRAARLQNGRLELTPKGRYFLVVLMREFFAGVNNLRQTCVDLSGQHQEKSEKLLGGLDIYSACGAEIGASPAADTPV
jgi:coproporphyrinogen III oxidase-like Fe-S oxidoreductase